jgi:hypothetical protein
VNTPQRPASPDDPAAATDGDQPLDDADLADSRELVDIPAVEVISRAAVLLMSAAAEQLGLAAADPDRPAHRDLDQARTLITALAGLVKASAPDLGPHAAAFRDGLAGLQGAFREYSIHPDEPGRGPGE